MKKSIENLVTCDLGGTKLLIRVCKKGACIERRFETGIDFKPAQFSEILSNLETEFYLDDYPMAIAFPGLLKGKSSYVSNVVPQFDGFDLTRLSSKAKLELVLNDVEAGTYGIINEDHKVEVLVMSGTGIGMGISIEGNVFRGESGFSGELGSCQTLRDGKFVRLAKIASGSALKENPELTQKESGRDLGMAVSWMINCFNPGRVVFAGGMFNEQIYREACFDAIESLSLQQSFQHCRIELEAEMHSIVVRGLEVALRKHFPATYGTQ